MHGCSLEVVVNGGSTVSILTCSIFTAENVRMQYLVDDRKVYSNTVINRFQQFRRNDEDRRNSKQLHETLTAFMYMYRYIHSDCAQCFKSCFNSNQLMTIYLMTLAKTTLIWYVLVHRGITSLYGSLTILYCKMIREQSPVSILTTTSTLIPIILQGSLRRKCINQW